MSSANVPIGSAFSPFNRHHHEALPLLPAIPAGKQAPSYDAPPSAKRSASTKTLNPSEALALAGPALLQRMLEAVRLQAKAICEINLHEQGPLSSLRAQGGWEIVRLCVFFGSDDCTREAAALEEFVWPELRERCAARRLHLIIIEPRQGWALLPPEQASSK